MEASQINFTVNQTRLLSFIFNRKNERKSKDAIDKKTNVKSIYFMFLKFNNKAKN